ncbi:MAG: hypothetical protein R8M45_11580 [Ghiorsea sp.]
MTPDGIGLLELSTPVGSAVAGYGFAPYGWEQFGTPLQNTGGTAAVPIPYYSALETREQSDTKETFSLSGICETQFAKPAISHTIVVGNVSDAPVPQGYSMFEVLDVVGASAMNGVIADANTGLAISNIVTWTPDYTNYPAERIRCQITQANQPERVGGIDGLFSFTFRLQEVAGDAVLQAPTFI